MPGHSTSSDPVELRILLLHELGDPDDFQRIGAPDREGDAFAEGIVQMPGYLDLNQFPHVRIRYDVARLLDPGKLAYQVGHPQKDIDQQIEVDRGQLAKTSQQAGYACPVDQILRQPSVQRRQRDGFVRDDLDPRTAGATALLDEFADADAEQDRLAA